MPVYGESEHQIDDKGRINIPRKFQSLFDKGGFLTRSFNGQSLVFYSDEAWQDVQQYLDAQGFTDTDADIVAQYLCCGTEVQLDAQGRLTVPPTLRRRAGFDKDVTLLGKGNRIELWDTATWLAYDREHLTAGNVTQALKSIGPRRAAV